MAEVNKCKVLIEKLTNLLHQKGGANCLISPTHFPKPIYGFGIKLK